VVVGNLVPKAVKSDVFTLTSTSIILHFSEETTWWENALFHSSLQTKAFAQYCSFVNKWNPQGYSSRSDPLKRQLSILTSTSHPQKCFLCLMYLDLGPPPSLIQPYLVPLFM
jgi:hypothetical protein